MNQSVKPSGAEQISVTAESGEAGERIDRLLAQRLPALSRSRLKGLIEGGNLTVEGARVVQPSAKVRAGQRLVLTLPPAEEADPKAEAIALDILFEDEDLLVLNKPAGMVVHPAPGNESGTLVNALIAHCGESLTGIGGVKRPGIVHRLDKDTSGVMVAAKTESAHTALSAAFAARDIDRRYQAVVWGLPSPSKGEIEGNIGRSPRNRKKMAVVPGGGKPARTRYSVVKSLAGGGAALVECKLMTGRTHQIRVHMTEIGHPLIGDPLYGGPSRQRLSRLSPGAAAAARAFPRQALHAATLGFKHPRSGEYLNFATNLPLDIVDLIQSLESL
ncbi:MAG: RluA family pseudouridine synthase [Limibacillus sp.]